MNRKVNDGYSPKSLNEGYTPFLQHGYQPVPKDPKQKSINNKIIPPKTITNTVMPQKNGKGYYCNQF